MYVCMNMLCYDTHWYPTSAIDNKPTSLTICWLTSISDGTGFEQDSLGYPNALLLLLFSSDIIWNDIADNIIKKRLDCKLWYCCTVLSVDPTRCAFVYYLPLSMMMIQRMLLYGNQSGLEWQNSSFR